MQNACQKWFVIAISIGKWGGIWEAPSTYDVSSRNAYQQDVKLLKKFSNWEYGEKSLQARVPYVERAKIKIGQPFKDTGCITGNQL